LRCFKDGTVQSPQANEADVAFTDDVLLGLEKKKRTKFLLFMFLQYNLKEFWVLGDDLSGHSDLAIKATCD
jgi:hypothetical protein